MRNFQVTVFLYENEHIGRFSNCVSVPLNSYSVKEQRRIQNSAKHLQWKFKKI